MYNIDKVIEDLPRVLHEWYLEATQKLDPTNYNPEAQKPFHKLNKDQQYIDRFIADKLKSKLQEAYEAGQKNCVTCALRAGYFEEINAENCCLRCGLSRQYIDKEKPDCIVYGKHFRNHLFA